MKAGHSFLKRNSPGCSLASAAPLGRVSRDPIGGSNPYSASTRDTATRPFATFAVMLRRHGLAVPAGPPRA